MMQDNQVIFETPDMSSVILSTLYEQQRSNRFCDLTLYINNKIVKLHRNVLACNSPYFDSILKQHKIVKEQLTISCLDNDTFDTFLEYMYTGKITIHSSNVEELLKLANHFIVNKIIGYCTEFLEKSLNINNCLFILDLIQRYNLKNISAVDNLINSKLNDIINGYELLNLPLQKLQSFIKYEVRCFKQLTP